MKRILSLLLAVVMLIAVLPVNAFAANEIDVGSNHGYMIPMTGIRKETGYAKYENGADLQRKMQKAEADLERESSAQAAQHNMILMDPNFVGTRHVAGKTVDIPFTLFCFGYSSEKYYVRIYNDNNEVVAQYSNYFPATLEAKDITLTWDATKQPAGKYWVRFYATYANDLDNTLFAIYLYDIDHLDTPKVTSAENLASSIRIYWDAVENAQGYYIYRQTESGSYTKIATVNSSKLSYTDPSVQDKNGTFYRYKVVAYYKGITSSGGTKSVVRLYTPVVSTLQNEPGGRLRVIWDRNSRANGYELKYRNGANTIKLTIGGNTAVNKLITGLLINKSYVVNVRSYKKVNDVTYYSGWSSTQTVRISE